MYSNFNYIMTGYNYCYTKGDYQGGNGRVPSSKKIQ